MTSWTQSHALEYFRIDKWSGWEEVSVSEAGTGIQELEMSFFKAGGLV